MMSNDWFRQWPDAIKQPEPLTKIMDTVLHLQEKLLVLESST